MKRTDPSPKSLGRTTKSNSSTPNTTPKKKKVSKSSRDDRGLKWFKGSPKKTPNKLKYLKTLLKEEPAPTLPLPSSSRIVEFEVEGGGSERLGVVEPLDIVEKNDVPTMDNLPLLSEICGGTESAYPETPSTSTNYGFFTTPVSLSSKVPNKGASKTKTKTKSAKKFNKFPKNINKTPKSSTSTNISQELVVNDSCSKDSNSNSKLPEASYQEIGDYSVSDTKPLPISYIRFMEVSHEELADVIEYDLDEEDCAWLELINEQRERARQVPVLPEHMEFLMDRLEKESHFQMQSSGIDQSPLIDDDAVCCICLDGECENSNAILFCDMCNLAVHQNCYGVPYIPEGQWLCRKCLESPSRPVDCLLCPNKGGAFKQTRDGKWAHVNCVLWVPEVCFANTVFLEPVDSVANIPPARWKLTCFICKQKGVGACIQCFKTSCYTAFHVTCAIQANLCMKMETVRDSSSHSVKKMAYCTAHAPPEFLIEKKEKEGEENASPRQKMKQTRKLLAEKRDAIPTISVPTIPPNRVEHISGQLQFPGKKSFMKRLMAYWKLKRQTRNGVPLIRRLQSSSSALLSNSVIMRRESMEVGSAAHRPQADPEVITDYDLRWIRLRQELEKARLLCELIRKREKLKRTVVNNHVKEMILLIQPINAVFTEVLDELKKRDQNGIFCEPVDLEDAPDYLTYITNPMDLSTMRQKVDSFAYTNLDQLEADFDLMIQNCLSYNDKETSYYKDGIRFRDQGGIVFRYARRQIESVGYDDEGRHTKERPHHLHEYSNEEILEEIDTFLADSKRFDYPPESHIAKLNELLDKALGLTNPLTRKKKIARIKNAISLVRKFSRSNIDGESYYSVNKRRSPQRTVSAPVASSSSTTPKRSPASNTKYQAKATRTPTTSKILKNLRSTRTSPAKNLRQRYNLSSPPALAIKVSPPNSTNIKGGRELRPVKRPPTTVSPQSISPSPQSKRLRSNTQGEIRPPKTPRKSPSVSPPRKSPRSASPIRKQTKNSLGAQLESLSTPHGKQPTINPSNSSLTKNPKSSIKILPPPPKTEPTKAKLTTEPLTNSQLFASALSCNKVEMAEGAVKEAGVSRNLFGVSVNSVPTATSPPKKISTNPQPNKNKQVHKHNGPMNHGTSLEKPNSENQSLEIEVDQNLLLRPPKLTSIKTLPPLPSIEKHVPRLSPQQLKPEIVNEDSSSSTGSASSSSSSSSSNSNSSSSSSSTCSTSSCASPHAGYHASLSRPSSTSQNSKDPYAKPPLSPDIVAFVPSGKGKYAHHHHHHHHKDKAKDKHKHNKNQEHVQGTPGKTISNGDGGRGQTTLSPSPTSKKKKSTSATPMTSDSPEPVQVPDPLMPKLVSARSTEPVNDLIHPPSLPSFTTYRSSTGGGEVTGSEENDEDSQDEYDDQISSPPSVSNVVENRTEEVANEEDENEESGAEPEEEESEVDEDKLTSSPLHPKEFSGGESSEPEEESEEEEEDEKLPEKDDPPYKPPNVHIPSRQSSSSSSNSSSSSSSDSSDEDDSHTRNSSAASSSSSSSSSDNEQESSTPDKKSKPKQSSPKSRRNGPSNNNNTTNSKSSSRTRRSGVSQTSGSRNCASPTLGDPKYSFPVSCAPRFGEGVSQSESRNCSSPESDIFSFPKFPSPNAKVSIPIPTPPKQSTITTSPPPLTAQSPLPTTPTKIQTSCL